MQTINVTRCFGLICFVFCLAGLQAQAQSSIVFEQTPLPQHNALFDSGGGVIRAADDFVLTESATIRMLRWWGGTMDKPSNGPFTVTFYGDSEGNPGEVLSQMNLESVQERLTGNAVVTFWESEYLAELSHPFEAMAGVKYWISIARAPDYSWGWEGSKNKGSSVYSVQGKDWVTTHGDTAFALLTEVPEPAVGSIVFGTLFLGILYRRR